MFDRLRFLSAGESHGPRLTAILDGFPAGLAIDLETIDADLARRQKGYGAGGRMSIERDRVRITGGRMAGRSTGGPIALEVINRDWANWADKDIPPMTTPRPGHADLTGAIKFGHRDLRLSLERASARETAMRVAAGAIAKQLLAACGIEVGAYVASIGSVSLELDPAADVHELRRRCALARTNDLSCPLDERLEHLRAEVSAAIKAKDTLGGVLEVAAIGAPPGLGSYDQWDRRLDARLTMALMSIQAFKGVEVGPAFANAARRGSEVHDPIVLDGARLARRGNRAGGIEGGISTGEPIVLRAAKKPISTVLKALDSVDLVSGEARVTTYERSDFCAAPRATPILEAMVALVLADALLCKLGGDSLDEILPRLASLRRGALDEFVLDNQPWRFGYEE